MSNTNNGNDIRKKFPLIAFKHGLLLKALDDAIANNQNSALADFIKQNNNNEPYLFWNPVSMLETLNSLLVIPLEINGRFNIINCLPHFKTQLDREVGNFEKINDEKGNWNGESWNGMSLTNEINTNTSKPKIDDLPDFIAKFRNAISHAHFDFDINEKYFYFWNESNKKINFLVRISFQNLSRFTGAIGMYYLSGFGFEAE